MTHSLKQVLNFVYVTLERHDEPRRWDTLDESVLDDLLEVAGGPVFTPEDLYGAVDFWRARMFQVVEEAAARCRIEITRSLSANTATVNALRHLQDKSKTKATRDEQAA